MQGPGGHHARALQGTRDSAGASHVVLANGAHAANVFWVVLGAASMGANSNFAGTIITSEAVTLGNLAQLNGRILAGDTVTLANNTITEP